MQVICVKTHLLSLRQFQVWLVGERKNNLVLKMLGDFSTLAMVSNHFKSAIRLENC